MGRSKLPPAKAATAKPPPLPHAKPPPLPEQPKLRASASQAATSAAKRRETMEVDLAWLEEVKASMMALPAAKRKASLTTFRASIAGMPAEKRHATMEVLLDWLEPEASNRPPSVSPRARKLPSLPPPPKTAARENKRAPGAPIRREED